MHECGGQENLGAIPPHMVYTYFFKHLYLTGLAH